jgi:hypothetical protein
VQWRRSPRFEGPMSKNVAENERLNSMRRLLGRLPTMARLCFGGVAMVTMLEGCSGDTHESVVAQIVGTLNEVADTYDGVTDAESARAALPKLRGLADRMRGLKRRAQSLGDPPQEALERAYRTNAFARIVESAISRSTIRKTTPRERDWLDEFDEESSKDAYKLDVPWLERYASSLSRPARQ